MTDLNTTQVTRVELINYNDGIAEITSYYNAKAVLWDIQDEGRTLKIFVSGGEELPNYNFLTGEINITPATVLYKEES